MTTKNYLIKNDTTGFDEKDLAIIPKTEWLNEEQWNDFVNKSETFYWLSFEEIFCEITGKYLDEITDSEFKELVKTKHLEDEIKYVEV